MSRTILCSLALAALIGCDDEGASFDTDDGAVAPITATAGTIQVSPDALEFTLESMEQTVTITNVGDSALQIEGVQLDGGNAFELGNMSAVLLEPDGVATFAVTFSGVGDDWADTLYIDSDDPEAPQVQIPVAAWAPQLTVSLTDLTASAGCEDAAPFTLINTGTADLEITGLEVELDDLMLGELTVEHEPLPWTIAPGASAAGDFSYAAEDSGIWSATLRVDAVDVGGGQHEQGFTITSASAGEVSESFESATPLDVLFALDKSCSMADDLAQLTAAIPEMVADLEERSVDYQLAAVTADDGCVNTEDDWIDVDTKDPQAAFSEMADGSYGAYTEAPFHLMEAALAQVAAGDCNAGLIRPGASLALIAFSDESEQSPGEWSYYQKVFQAVQSDPALVTVHAFNMSDQSGGYTELIEATGGLQIWLDGLTDYAAALVEINDVVLMERSVLPLTEVPRSGTIALTITQGSYAEPIDAWSYDAEANAVVLDAPLETNEIATVTYDRQATCE